jgi:hypothetical protein
MNGSKETNAHAFAASSGLEKSSSAGQPDARAAV